jgi:hypothetical protein
MALRHDDLTPEQQERQRKYDVSFAAARRARSDSAFMAAIYEAMAEIDSRPAEPALTREEFLAETARYAED